MEDTLTFAHRVGAKRLLLFHHDPLHSDVMLERMEAQARKRWVEMGHSRASIDLAREGIELEVEGHWTACPSGTGGLLDGRYKRRRRTFDTGIIEVNLSPPTVARQ